MRSSACLRLCLRSLSRSTIDKFPIPRGAVVILDKTTALLWVHGVTPNAMNPSWKYYQGKRRIATPLLIRRYRGQSDITQVATEILGPSKMNWNTFDYYSRLPATLDSASAIAKVGAYLSGFGSAPKRLPLAYLRVARREFGLQAPYRDVGRLFIAETGCLSLLKYQHQRT